MEARSLKAPDGSLPSATATKMAIITRSHYEGKDKELESERDLQKINVCYRTLALKLFSLGCKCIQKKKDIIKNSQACRPEFCADVSGSEKLKKCVLFREQLTLGMSGNFKLVAFGDVFFY